MIILGIETSCDETAASVVKDGRIVMSNIIASSAQIFEEYGGVVPEIASRKHVEYILMVIDQAIKKAGIKKEELDAIAVTQGPGLVGALLVGITAAKALAAALDIPLIPVNHLKGHIAANYITHKDLKPPFVCLLVSGGHTNILNVNNYDDIQNIGSTRDDAVGEAYDKVGRVMGLVYPGGPKIDKMAIEGNPEAILFPRTKFKDNPFDFSFSGLKTAVINYIHSKEQKNEEYSKKDVAASFQKAVTDVLVENVFLTKSEKIVVAGGVAANQGLRKALYERADKEKVQVYFPDIHLCTDNAAMIGSAAYYIKEEDFDINADPSLEM
ncbi:MAG: tRNA (adenosine(37)-N6)-threonylcarbamoyltransferase complex transferase subunit TsaD [Clostridia bacterium]|nr:tRNA (adenosine(37)-N6)-threonylcarbamoyltransferase complex transferase subunit TsaD [Clostridia bacterium]MDD3093190.1 tRNA (adenosine(37)-N6)-threonylcarbamoyltransferase complex transferase subunit TsaD [Clostridia bacterium]MDD4542625.1 tRNA (adenosine(37)-N6)-threonylcarbamoyltransferase complex transferase subunit TsaD [Clostridia bacterium]HXK71604.1 tRNA (adenosine(37)-N6)-threonylcarbamoyltransferase complex transferase subunit TsaD [Clostridia bacterium]